MAVRSASAAPMDGETLVPTCNICGCSRFVDMAPNPASIFVRPKVQCDGCHSLERHRLLYELLQTRSYLNGARRVLHVAPEPGLARALLARFGAGYLACDIDPARYPGLSVTRLDLCTDLARFSERSFDIVIHNHVLEHLACDYKAVLRQLDRLVAPGGVHAFTVPFMEGGFRESFSDGEADRLKNFGQTDHYRVFSTEDLATTIAAVVEVPELYDVTAMVSPERLREIGVPENQWRGYNNNAVFFIEKGADAAPGPVAAEGSMAGGMPLRSGERRPAVLFVSANGVGRGHITRQMAVASRLGRRSAFFLTMSYAARMVAANGFPFQFVPHHDVTGEPAPQWHANLAREIELILDRTGADVLVYDVNFVFDGVIEVLRRRQSLKSVWIRRAMWPQAHRSYIGAGVHFSTIVEPADLAEALDDGPTVDHRTSVERVPPVLMLDPADRMTREKARDAFSLPHDQTVVMVDLLPTKIDTYARLRERVLQDLLGRPHTCVVELEPMLGTFDTTTTDVRHRIIRVDAAFRYSRAWDAAITRCGYNIFHEHMLGAVPSIFVPNDAPSMDRQSHRSRWAEVNDYGASLAVEADASQLRGKLDQMLDGAWRERVASNCRRLSGQEWQNGAETIARLIDGV